MSLRTHDVFNAAIRGEEVVAFACALDHNLVDDVARHIWAGGEGHVHASLLVECAPVFKRDRSYTPHLDSVSRLCQSAESHVGKGSQSNCCPRGSDSNEQCAARRETPHRGAPFNMNLRIMRNGDHRVSKRVAVAGQLKVTALPLVSRRSPAASPTRISDPSCSSTATSERPPL